jgi:hypothetical protein
MSRVSRLQSLDKTVSLVQLSPQYPGLFLRNQHGPVVMNRIEDFGCISGIQSCNTVSAFYRGYIVRLTPNYPEVALISHEEKYHALMATRDSFRS